MAGGKGARSGGKRKGGGTGGDADAGADDALTIALKRSAEMAAMFMIGDGALGLLQAARHVALWRTPVGAVDALVRPFAGHPGRRRVYGALQIATGVALAASLRRRGR